MTQGNNYIYGDEDEKNNTTSDTTTTTTPANENSKQSKLMTYSCIFSI
ncbi:hypothetical protein A3Q56_05159 [Intoshia linei]|uniref:Uncharacterized protein n=1 Tax=Intoshia linei TaxID=1819745 RepID=A0A177AYJ0_9BILA|nr:hypothetical protein A3Q56_05159 [Intoshia linei]